MKRRKPAIKKRQSFGIARKVQLVGIFVVTIAVLAAAVATNSDIRTFLSQAADVPFDQATTMKQRNIVPQSADPVAGDEDDQGVGAPDIPDEEDEEERVPTSTPQPVPTAAQETCRVGGIVRTNCTCPDTRGLKCNGETTKMVLSDGVEHTINNFYNPPQFPSDRDKKTESEGQYVWVKNAVFYNISRADYEVKKKQPNCTEWCIGAPVIYLYPQTPTVVDVQVSVPGYMYISEPLYPAGGWKNVLAQPNGNLTYQGRQYRDLYYETALSTGLKVPENGILIPTAQLHEKLTEYTQKLGLTPFESSEFVAYWMPYLNEIDAPYFLFSILDPVEKERVDKVTVSPNPDTFIAFIAYFKPVYNNYTPPLLVLPENPPQRIGFTVVEWGGTIDRKAIR